MVVIKVFLEVGRVGGFRSNRTVRVREGGCGISFDGVIWLMGMSF